MSFQVNWKLYVLDWAHNKGKVSLFNIFITFLLNLQTNPDIFFSW